MNVASLKRFSVVFSLLICVAIVLAQQNTAHADELEMELYSSDSQTGSCGDGAFWTLGEDGTLTIGGSGYISSSPWTSHSDEIFKIVIEDEITGMGISQFNGLPMVESVEIGSGITDIPRTAFANLPMLHDLTIGENVETIGRQAFFSCRKLKKVVIPDSVRSIDAAAFIYCGVEEVVIGNQVESIGEMAFEGCAMESISLPSTLSSVGVLPFPVTVKTIDVSSDNQCVFVRDDSLCSRDSNGETTLVQIFNEGAHSSYSVPEGITRIGDWAFGEGVELDELVISNDVRYIGSYVNANSHIKKVIIGDSVQTIGSDAFIELQQIEIGQGVQTIGSHAFRGGVRAITLPPSVKRIGSQAFVYCPNLTDITIPLKNAPQAASELFANKSHRFDNDLFIHVPPGSSGYDEAPWTAGTVVEDLPPYYKEGNCGDNLLWTLSYDGTLTITGTGDMQNYGNDSSPWFAQKAAIKKIIIGEGVTSVGSGAFERCGYVSEVAIPSTVKSLGNGCFYQCSGITEVVLPDGLTWIDASAFADCEHLGSMVVPGMVEHIGDGAFRNCTGLTSVDIPDSVDGFGDGVFRGVTAEFHVKMGSTADSYLQQEVMNIKYVCAYGHAWMEDYTIDSEASCVENGSKSKHCEICGQINDGSIVPIAALGHDYKSAVTVPTCTEGGFTTWTCSRCGGSYVDSETQAKGHRFESYTPDGNATCVADGTKTAECANGCGAKYTVADEGSALGHEWGEWQVTRDPTCTAKGERRRTCENDATHIETEDVDALGHSFPKVYTVDKAATCTEEGSESIHCTACDEQKPGSARAIGKTPHAYGEWDVTMQPTCTEKGSREKVCAGCGDKVTEDVDALSHDLTKVERREATCTAGGNVEHFACERCAELFIDSDARQAASIDEIEVAAKGHAWGGWQVTKPASCTEGGVETRKCENDASHVETRAIAATGHAWGAGVVTRAATYDAVGTRTYTCGNCGETRAEAISRLARTSLSKATVSVPAKAAYTGKRIAPVPTVRVGGRTLTKGRDYTVSYGANVNAGKATVTVTGKGAYAGSKTVAFTIAQAANKAIAKSTSVRKTLRLADLRKRAQTVSLPAVTARFGKARWVVVAKDKKGVLRLKDGKVQVKKGAKAGTYTVKLKANVAQTKNYKAASAKVVTVKVTVVSGKAR